MKNYDLFQVPEERKAPPKQLARFANIEARRIFDLYTSWKTLFARVQRIVNQPGIQELVEATPVHRFLGYALSVMFLAGLFVEWNFSQEVYASHSGTAFLFFLGLVLAGLYASACFNTLAREFRSRVSTQKESQEYYEIVYENEGKTTKSWSLLHPLNGLIVFILVELIVYTLSSQRIAWQQSAGLEGSDDIWLPCVWFALEVLFGMGFHFMLEHIFVSWRYHRYEKQLAIAEADIEERTQKCLEAWQTYSEVMQGIEQQALENDTPCPDRIAANDYLRALLHREAGEGDEKHLLKQLP